MSLRGNRWVWLKQEEKDVNNLAENLKISPTLARVVLNRGINDLLQAEKFFAPALDQLHSPWLMNGMEEAVWRLVKAIDDGEKIVVHGDYDADGITATAIMVEALRSLGAEVALYLPSRFENGYGLHPEPLEEFRNQGASLVVTVDCGINAVEEIKLASSIGLDMIITDHHQPLAENVQAVAVINPLQEKCPYPFKELSGAGVALKLAAALAEKFEQPFPCHLLDLAAIGTAADVVPLKGENRVIITEGIKVLKTLGRPGFKALVEAVSLDPDKINSTTLSFVLAPHINAAGRMGDALPAAKLMLEKEANLAADYARQLCKANQVRKETERTILEEAESKAKEQLALNNPKIITIAGTDWHHGVIGIVASRLVDMVNRPVALVALDGDEGIGSARSVTGFNITEALEYCKEFLERFGGHEQAAGFTVRADNFAPLQDSLNEYALQNLDDSQLQPTLTIDAELDYPDMTNELAHSLEKLEPFGTDNSTPIFGSRDWELVSWRAVGKDKSHLKLDLKKNGKNIQPIFFSAAEFLPAFEKGRLVDVAFTMQNGSYRGEKTLDHIIKDLSFSDCHHSDNLEIIDWRNRDKKNLPIREILTEQEGRAVILTATAKAGKQLIGLNSRGQEPVIITNGAAGALSETSSRFKLLLLYDLPLHEGVLKNITGNLNEMGLERIYLAYGNKDLDFNHVLLDRALPSADSLKMICDNLIDAAKKGLDEDFPGPAADALSFKPVSSFWKRSLEILTETGFLDNGKVSPHYVEIMKTWPQPLEKSGVYRESIELRKGCAGFQELFLTSSPQLIASFFQGCRVPEA